MTVPPRWPKGCGTTRTVFFDKTRDDELVEIIKEWEAERWRVLLIVKSSSRKWIVVFR